MLRSSFTVASVIFLFFIHFTCSVSGVWLKVKA